MKTGGVRRWWGGLVGLSLIVSGVRADVIITPEASRHPPKQAWLVATLGSVEGVTWAEIEVAARGAAIAADAANRTSALTGWLLVAKWARLLATDQTLSTNRWVNALNAAKLGHQNIGRIAPPAAEPLSALISAECAVALVGDAAFSRSFFDQLTPYDFLPKVLQTLDLLYRADSDRFQQYEQLALAIALVFDVPPPPHWPHSQVSAALLSRHRPTVLEAFGFWTESDRRRETLHRLNQLTAAELKFVVDAAAPWSELGWVQRQEKFDFAALPRTYDAVKYQTDRFEQGVYQWPGTSYALSEILAQGGICIDQGYFATEVGKARGVPTLLFRGVGLDGRHAWFGYLDAHKQWQLDVGRYAEQKYVSGIAFDPQTWGNVNDHELAFLAERFRLLPQYQQSQSRQWLAEEFLRLQQFSEAAHAARRAVNYEPRNVRAWEVLLLAQQGGGVAVVKREAAMREAARALQRYPDLQARFMQGVISLMRERGQVSAADHEELQLTKQLSADRSDLALAQAAGMLNRSLAGDDPVTQLRVFESALRQFGVTAGMGAFDRLVKPFFNQTMTGGRKADAQQILAIARRVIPIEAGSQFDRELRALDEQAAGKER